MQKRVKEENRIVVVLSDGMGGHGVKANMLATLTATMAMNLLLSTRTSKNSRDHNENVAGMQRA